MNKKTNKTTGAKATAKTRNAKKAPTKKATAKQSQQTQAQSNELKKAPIEKDKFGAKKNTHLECVNDAVASFGASFATMRDIVAKARELAEQRKIELRHKTYYDHCNRLVLRGAFEREIDSNGARVFRVKQAK